MKTSRQKEIISIIKEQCVTTQQQLAEILNNEGFNVTQATVSRDIKNLGLIKQQREGKSCYALPPKSEKRSGERFKTMLDDVILSVESAGHMIVVKTLPGFATPASDALDHLNDPAILGTLAGENTLFIVVRDTEDIPSIVAKIKQVTE